MDVTITLPAEEWAAVIDCLDIFSHDHDSAFAHSIANQIFDIVWEAQNG